MLDLFFFQAEDGIRDYKVTGVQTCALPIWLRGGWRELLMLERQRQEMLGRHRLEAQKDAERMRLHLEDLRMLEEMTDCRSFRPQGLGAEAAPQRLGLAADACVRSRRPARPGYARERP